MTNFGWWQSEVNAVSNGAAFMCMLCFEVFPKEAAYTDAIGQMWEMCGPCGLTNNVGEQPGPEAAEAEDRPERQRVTEVTPVPEYLSGAKLFAPTVAPALEGPTVPSGSRAAAEAPNPSPLPPPHPQHC